MDKDTLNLHVVENDQVIDLRGNEFPKMQGGNSQNSARSTKKAVKRAGDAGDKKSFEQKDANTARFKNFAAEKRNLLHRHATNSNRPVSTDPRFRRRRSPEKLPDASQSTAVLETTNDQLHNKIIKSRSASATAFNIDVIATNSRHHKSKQETMTDGTQQNDVTLRSTTSSYETAITDLKFTPRSDEICSINTVRDFDMPKSKQISPYWNDSRLMEKHCDVLKPVIVLKTRKSFSVPIPPPPTKGDKNWVTCPKRFCERNQTLHCKSYNYDDCTVIDDSGLSEKTINTKFEKNSHLLTPFMILRVFYGLIIVSALVWLVNPIQIWRYYQGNRVEKNTSTGIFYVAKNIAGVVLHGCDCVVTAVLRLLGLPVFIR